MRFARFIALAVLAAMFVPVLAVAPVLAKTAMILPTEPAPLVAVTPGGEKRRFSIEIADEAHERSAGLMFRYAMADDHGMLFVFPNTGRTSFWMKNTPMALDIIFAGADGRVIATLPGKPYSLSFIDPGKPVRFVLEVKAGIARKNGIVPGTLLRHPAIDAVSGAQ